MLQAAPRRSTRSLTTQPLRNHRASTSGFRRRHFMGPLCATLRQPRRERHSRTRRPMAFANCDGVGPHGHCGPAPSTQAERAIDEA